MSETPEDRIQRLESENEYLKELLSWNGMNVTATANDDRDVPLGKDEIRVSRSHLMDLQKQVSLLKRDFLLVRAEMLFMKKMVDGVQSHAANGLQEAQRMHQEQVIAEKKRLENMLKAYDRLRRSKGT